MKAVSIQQPFASLICAGIKDIENRSRKTNYRGKIFIHASAKWHDKITKGLPANAFNTGQICSIPDELWSKIEAKLLKKNSDLATSAIIGEVEIVDCVINHKSIWAEKSIGIWVGSTFVHKPEHPVTWNWVLANAVLYDKPILNVKGKLSLWQPDTSLINKILQDA